MTHTLTRRDALAALAAAGTAVAGCSTTDDDADDPLDEATRETLIGAAEVLYPDGVEEIPEFVREYARGRTRDRPDHAAGVADAVASLEEYSEAWFDDSFAALSAADRDAVFRRMSLTETDPDPTGSDRERVRYYVIDELLFALYRSPTGGRLVGIENPPGHPGGTDSYQRGPP